MMETFTDPGLFLLMTGGMMAFSYASIAKQRGWATARIFSPGTWLTLSALVLTAAAIVLCFVLLSWWKALLLILAAFLMSGVLTVRFEHRTQVFSMILLVTGLLLVLASRLGA